MGVACGRGRLGGGGVGVEYMWVGRGGDVWVCGEGGEGWIGVGEGWKGARCVVGRIDVERCYSLKWING